MCEENPDVIMLQFQAGAGMALEASMRDGIRQEVRRSSQDAARSS